MLNVKPPSGLGTTGKSLWKSIAQADKYELRPDELVTLESACRASDRTQLMRDELEQMPLMLTGSTGQLVVNPLVAEIRAHEAQVGSLLAKLKLPDDPSGAAEETRSTKARAAAQSKWAAAHGAGS